MMKHKIKHGDGIYIGELNNKRVPNGKGTKTWPNGNKYVGLFKNGTGIKGTLFFANGEKYTGQFKSGDRHGKGKYTWPSGRKYVGQWKKGKFSGKGITTWLIQKKQTSMCVLISNLKAFLWHLLIKKSIINDN